MLQDDHLDYNDDYDCIRVAEFVLEWASADDPYVTTATELRETTLLQFLTDILAYGGNSAYRNKCNALLDKIRAA